MNNSELRGNLTKWINEYSSLVGPVPEVTKLVDFLAARIEDTVFIEQDEDVIMVLHKDKRQPARVLSEDKARGTVMLSLLHDKSFLCITYPELKRISSGTEIVSALDKLNGTSHSQMAQYHS